MNRRRLRSLALEWPSEAFTPFLEGVNREACLAKSGQLFSSGVPALLNLLMCPPTGKPSQPYFPVSWIFKDTGTVALK